nr:arylesterase [Tropicimonas sp. IMCC34011]
MVAASLPALAAADTIRVAALGDSLTQGYGLPAEDGLVPQLEAWLTERGHDVDVLNAGVSGDTTAGGLSRAAFTLEDDPDAMIVALGGNDMLRGIDPDVSRANLDGILSAASEAGVEVLLVGLTAPGNYGPDFAERFDAMYPELAETYGVQFHPDFFSAFRAEAEAGNLRTYMQADGIHPNATGVKRIVEAIGPSVEELLARAAE